jgi:predicted permease
VLFAVSPLTAREAIVLSALPAGFFGILFGLRFGIASEVTGTTLVVSTILSAATLSAAIYHGRHESVSHASSLDTPARRNNGYR